MNLQDSLALVQNSRLLAFLASYAFSRLLEYFDVCDNPLPAPKPLVAAALCTFYFGIQIPYCGSFPRLTPLHIGQVLLTVFQPTVSCLSAGGWGLLLKRSVFPALSTKVLVIWFVHETFCGLSSIPSGHAFFSSWDYCVGRAWWLDLGSNFDPWVSLRNDFGWDSSCA